MNKSDISDILTSNTDEIRISEDVISIPIARYEQLLRAETELNILEAVIEGGPSYLVDVAYKAIKKAREKAWAQKVVTVTPEKDESHAE